MLDEATLHEKLSTLQAHLLKFHEDISPKKQEVAKHQLPTHDEKSKNLSPSSSIAYYICLYTMGVALLPAITYCVEGSSRLFWQVTAVSCVIAFILLVSLTATVMCFSVEKLQYKIQEMLNVVRNNIYNIKPLLHLWDVMTSDFVKLNIHKVLYPLVLILVAGVVAYVTYTRDIWVGFYASLITIGFTTGILSAILCDFLSSPELLPFHSPCKIKMAVITPSPQVKRELEFEAEKEQVRTPISRYTGSYLTPMIGSSNTGAQNIASILPNYSSSIIHGKKMEDTSNVYQLPIKFSNFFRTLQSGQ